MLELDAQACRAKVFVPYHSRDVAAPLGKLLEADVELVRVRRREGPVHATVDLVGGQPPQELLGSGDDAVSDQTWYGRMYFVHVHADVERHRPGRGEGHDTGVEVQAAIAFDHEEQIVGNLTGEEVHRAVGQGCRVAEGELCSGAEKVVAPMESAGP